MIRTLVLMGALMPMLALAQPTTEEEYNYLSRGYKIQVESGLDMKKGYRVDVLDATVMNVTGTELKMEFQGLYREGKNVPCGFMLAFSLSGTSGRGYMAIPSHDAPKALWDRTFADMDTRFQGQREVLRAVLIGFMRLATLEASRGGPSLYKAGRAEPIEEDATTGSRLIPPQPNPGSLFNPSANGEIRGNGYSGQLKRRAVVTSPSFGNDNTEAGKVAVDIRVSPSGAVVYAKGRLGSPTTTTSSQLHRLAEIYARQFTFTEDPKAEGDQEGFIVFEFTLQ